MGVKQAAESMDTNQRIKREIELLLLEYRLSGDTVQTIKEWIQIRNMDSKTPYPWAQLILTIGDTLCATPDACLPGATAMELYTMAADILDDIEDQDNDELPWRKVSTAEAINMATCILFLSFKALTIIKNPRYYRQVNDTFQHMGLVACEGQSEEFSDEKKEVISLDRYFETVKKKSGVLTSGACKIGAILANCNEDLIRNLEQFGEKIGMFSQVKNDLHDFLKLETKSDFIKGKKTLPMVYLTRVLHENAAEELQYLCSLAQQDCHRFSLEGGKRLHQLIIQEGAVQYCAVICTMFKQQALDILDGMEITEEQRRKLSKLVG